MTKWMIALIVASALATLAATPTETCFYKSDKVDGLNRICFYSCVSGDAATTIKASQICPLSIKR